MHRSFLRPLLVAAGQCAGICLLGALLGLVWDGVRAQPAAMPAQALSGACGEEGGIRELSPEAADVIIGGAQVTVLDVRAPERYEAGHLPTAVNLPASVVEDAVAQGALPFPADDTLIVYCESTDCELSTQLAELLQSAGECPQVAIIEGGWPAWVAAGLPVEGPRP